MAKYSEFQIGDLKLIRDDIIIGYNGVDYDIERLMEWCNKNCVIRDHGQKDDLYNTLALLCAARKKMQKALKNMEDTIAATIKINDEWEDDQK